MKLLKKATLLALAVIMSCNCLSLFGCGKPDKVSANVSVRSADSSTKFRLNETEKGDKNYRLDYNMVRNEYESYQLLISADADVSSYYLNVTDLKCGDNVLSKENITAYMQRYSFLNSGADIQNYGGGYYPDALVPIEAAKKAGELKVTANENSALWVTVYAPKDLKAGLYTGSFKLTVGDKDFNVPVSVNVNDYTLTDGMNTETSFNWRFPRIGSGEMDYSTEMLEKYYDFFVDYRISLDHPVTDDPSNNPKEFAEAVIENWEKMTTFSYMPLWGVGPTGNLSGGKWTTVKEQICELAERSSPDVNYLTKGLLYFIDEPDLTKDSVLLNCISQLKDTNRKLAALVDEIENDTTGRYDNFKQIDGWKESVTGIRNIIPLNLSKIYGRLGEPKIQDFLSVANCFCPIWKNQSSPAYEETVKVLTEQYGIELWWYGCVDPKAPYGTYHIGDTNLLSSRSVGWLQLMYNLTGLLYWDAAAYTYYAGDVLDTPCNIDETPYRTPGYSTDVGGDGFLCYAGARYGIYGPIPSMRLMSIRDGIEEYELLYALKNEIVGLNNANLNAQSEIERICESLYYNGSMLYAQGENNLDIAKLRAEVIDTLTGIKDGTNFFVSSVATKDGYAVVQLTIDSSKFDLYYGANKLTENNGLYKTTFPLTYDGFFTFTLVNKTTGEKIEKIRYIGVLTTKLIDFNSITTVPAGSLVLANGDSCVINTDENKTSERNMKFTINSKITGSQIADKIFTPEFGIKSDLLKAKLDQIVYIHLDIYNLSSEMEKMTIFLKSGLTECEYTSVTLNVGLNSVEIPFNAVTFGKLSTADCITFRFENKGTQESPYVHTVCIDNMYAVLKEV